ncbi:class I SAM-dependent methyltransferase [Paraconexibacter antarcticus]|uniref:Class I SAM-dependent methyltransferase n=1 Tax=Paraconexibacter antarcticus TaxID=2949664 RepID=A0ABY5DX85_9ACTN|nr:class I SAM-dependent methyltransferase [Paraconexibacter antarcticus]UTI66638.1 class I SAM-dependent methyltransferase [Paraconexibacter antarcticus]
MSLYGRLFTAIYDPFLAWGERSGMAKLRRSILAQASGDVLEVGAGTGLNLRAYPAAVTRLTLADPEPSMADRLRSVAAGDPRRPTVVQAGAEALPFPDASFDTVVSTLVLCTVDDVAGSLAEIRRVLRPGGRLLLIEHVRADGSGLSGWQDRLEKPWKAFGYGCRCNRDTRASLTRAGFETGALQDARWPRMPPIVAPLLVGPVHPA